MSSSGVHLENFIFNIQFSISLEGGGRHLYLQANTDILLMIRGPSHFRNVEI